MGLIILLVVGGLIGWVASTIMRDNTGILMNIVIGVVGAIVAGFVVTPLIGGAPITSGIVSIQSILVSLVGAIVLLAIVNLVRRGAAQCGDGRPKRVVERCCPTTLPPLGGRACFKGEKDAETLCCGAGVGVHGG